MTRKHIDLRSNPNKINHIPGFLNGKTCIRCDKPLKGVAYGSPEGFMCRQDCPGVGKTTKKGE